MFSLRGKLDPQMSILPHHFGLGRIKKYDFVKSRASFFSFKNCDSGVDFEDNTPKHHHKPINPLNYINMVSRQNALVSGSSYHTFPYLYM